MKSLLNIKFIAGLTFGVLITFFVSSIPLSIEQYFGLGPPPAPELVLKSLARRIYTVQKTIRKEAEIGGKASEEWAIELEAVVAQLYPSILHGPDSDSDSYEADSSYVEDINAKENEVTTAKNPVQKLEEVKEETPAEKAEKKKKIGSLSMCKLVDYKRNNIFLYDCTNINEFNKVVSVILLCKEWSVKRVNFVVENISKYYNVSIHVAVFGKNFKFAKNLDKVKVYEFTELDTTGKAIKVIIPNINTPYTFISHDLTHFDNTSSIESLISVFDEIKGLAVSAGSFRDLLGAWNHGCFQVQNRNYYLSYEKGYYYSKIGYMFCDDVLGPFVAKTSLLKSVEFSEEMNGRSVFHDWFIRVRLEGQDIVSCPHSMFFVNNSEPVSRKDWRLIATRWQLQDVKAHDETSYHFTCPEVNINCFFLFEKVSHFLVPPCCVEERTKELEYIKSCANKLNLEYQLIAGSMIGPTKMDSFLLWDFDNDLIIDCKHMPKWVTQGKECLSKHGCGTYIYSKTYVVAKCPLTDIDIACSPNMTEGLPYIYQHIPTTVVARGRTWNIRPNPGMSSFLKYGFDYLRHVVHWRHDSGLSKGFWKPCISPDSHKCLDLLPTDGSIPFKRPFPDVIGDPIAT